MAFRDFFGRFARRAAPAIVRRESLDLPNTSRRRFILTAAAGGAGLLLVPKAAKLLLPDEGFVFSGFQTIAPSGLLYNELQAVTRRANVPTWHTRIYQADPLLKALLGSASIEKRSRVAAG